VQEVDRFEYSPGHLRVCVGGQSEEREREQRDIERQKREIDKRAK